MPPRLPGAANCLVERRKVLEYLLADRHPDGRSKAAFFRKFGFSRQGWRILANALRRIARQGTVVKAVRSQFGVRYTVVGDLEAPDGRRPALTTAWIVERNEWRPRLVTAYPSPPEETA